MLSKNQLKYITSLQHKKFRDEENAFIVETEKNIFDGIESNSDLLLQFITTEKWLENHPDLKIDANKIFIAEDFQFEKISTLKNPKPVLAIFKKPKIDLPKIVDSLTIVLDDIQDPGNLGTIIRIADWFGVKQIICSESTVDQYNPKVVQSTMGSIFRVNVFHTNLEKWLSNQKLPIYASAMNGINIAKIAAKKDCILIIGNEGKGISESVLGLANETVSIPTFGNAESLNAAIATGILLYELKR